MPKGKKTGGRDFTLNDPRAGRKPLPEDLKQVKALTKQEVALTISKFARMTKDELANHLRSPGATLLDNMIGSVLLRAVRNSDHYRFEFLLRRSAGPVDNNVNLGAQESLHSALVSAFDKIESGKG